MTPTPHFADECTCSPRCSDRAVGALADIMIGVARLQFAGDLSRYGFELEEFAEVLNDIADAQEAAERRASRAAGRSG